MRKYPLPSFLEGKITNAAYVRWLQRKATAHARRDRKRGNHEVQIYRYKEAIHKAVLESNGRDAYTGERLHWNLLSSYSNEASRAGRRKYKAELCLLPTVDHVGDGLGPANFMICAWRTNDAKADLTYSDFVKLCRRVVAHREKQRRPAR